MTQTRTLSQDEQHDILLSENAPRLLHTLENIVDNATLIPDPAKGGATDTFSVPTDDIEKACRVVNLVAGSDRTPNYDKNIKTYKRNIVMLDMLLSALNTLFSSSEMTDTDKGRQFVISVELMLSTMDAYNRANGAYINNADQRDPSKGEKQCH